MPPKLVQLAWFDHPAIQKRIKLLAVIDDRSVSSYLRKIVRAHIKSVGKMPVGVKAYDRKRKDI